MLKVDRIGLCIGQDKTRLCCDLKKINPEVSGLAEQMSVSQFQCVSTVVHQGGSAPYSHLGSQLVRNVSILQLHNLEHTTSWVTTEGQGRAQGPHLTLLYFVFQPKCVVTYLYTVQSLKKITNPV